MAIYPELTLVYIYQGYVTVKKGENIIYADYEKLGQIVPVANVFKDLKKCILKENETKIA